MFVQPIKLSALGKHGKKCRISKGVKLVGAHNVFMGDDCGIGEDCLLMCTRAKIIIGPHVMIATRTAMITGGHRTDMVGRYLKSIKNSEKLPENDKDIIIEGDNWIGANVTILKGLTIGEGAIVGAGSVVTKDVPPYSIVCGVPAKVVKMRFTEEEIKEHKRLIDKTIPV